MVPGQRSDEKGFKMADKETKEGTKASERRENRFYFHKKDFRSLPRLFAEATNGTPFEGSRLVFTGNRGWNGSYEFELIATVDVYQTIPGYQLVGYARTEDGKTFHVHRLADFGWDKGLVNELDPLRCDVCEQRRVRKRQFVVREIETGELLFVGGSCARKFCDIDLEKLIRKFFRESERVFDGIRRGLDAEAVFRDTCFKVALAEEIVRRKGYVSQKKAEIENGRSTAMYVWAYFARKLNGELTNDAKEVHELVKPSLKSILERAKEFEDTHFKELIDHFEAKLADTWSEFDNNCVAYLKGIKFSVGLAAFFGSIRSTLDGEVAENKTKRREAVKGFDGAVKGKCSDLGRFLVVNTRWKQTHFGDALAFTCVSEDGGKLWFKVTEGCKAERDWNAAVGDRWIREGDGVEIELRGTVTEIKEDISFANRVKIQGIYENGEAINA